VDVRFLDVEVAPLDAEVLVEIRVEVQDLILINFFREPVEIGFRVSPLQHFQAGTVYLHRSRKLGNWMARHSCLYIQRPL
jgi:hypothetical protein